VQRPDHPAPGSEVDLLSHGGSWTWLLDVRRRLNLSIELVDAKLTPLLPPPTERAVIAARRVIVDLENATLRNAAARAIQSQKQEIVSINDGKIACTPFGVAAGHASGALLVADRNPDHRARDERQLSRIGWWLAGAMNVAPSSGATADTSELHRLASLHRLLGQAAARTSERDLVRVFIDALAVWQDAESWAYLGDLKGEYSLQVALPGSDRSRAPASFHAASLPEGENVRRLSAADRVALGFPAGGELMLARVSGKTSSDWTIVTSGDPTPQNETRLVVYLGVLMEALNEITAVESSRLTWAMVQHLLPSAESLEQAAARAVDDLSAAMGGTASLAVRRGDGHWALAIGEAAELLFDSRQPGQDGLLVSAIEIAPPFSAAVAIRRSSGRPIGRRDERLLQSAAFTLSAWLRAVSGRLSAAPERRKTPRSFEQIVEQHTRQAAESEQDLSLIVFSLAADPVARQTQPATVGWIGAIRKLLRPGDLAGRLLSGDIAVLLPDTPEQGAEVVVERITKASGPCPLASIGRASRPPGSGASHSLLAAARPRGTGHRLRSGRLGVAASL
jgi:hypothetical protein